MEKPSPHYRLSTVKSLIASGHVRATITAANCAKALGVSGLPEMCEIVLSLTRGGLLQEHDKSFRPSGLAGRLLRANY